MHGLDLMNLRRIGAGGFGKVYLVARRKDGTLYAAKYQKIKDKRTQRLVGKTDMICGDQMERGPVEHNFGTVNSQLAPFQLEN